MDELIPGKHYRWPIDNVGNYREGLFTGEYDYRNGNAIFVTKNGDVYGDRWSIPAKDAILIEKSKKGKKK